ncbi:MAG: potassium-transporting ATPase subunit C [Acidimicrobiales bacterium]
MRAHVRQSVALAVVCVLLFGLAYGLLGTAIAQLFFRHQADGSITASGSTLIGQNWNGYSTTTILHPRWFHGRPDADDPLHATGRSGESEAANLGPRSAVLEKDVHSLVVAWHGVGVNPTTDLVTTSGSGLDPDITPADAVAQIPMVSRATGVSAARLRRLVARETSDPELGFLGSSYVVVLRLNESLSMIER